MKKIIILAFVILLLMGCESTKNKIPSKDYSEYFRKPSLKEAAERKKEIIINRALWLFNFKEEI